MVTGPTGNTGIQGVQGNLGGSGLQGVTGIQGIQGGLVQPIQLVLKEFKGARTNGCTRETGVQGLPREKWGRYIQQEYKEYKECKV